ncbi:carbohydrate-binding domain-containing protein [Paenibacillus alkalitolerans]|uniref:carbohydrate-binding domain-containing protein n=1 Tax=Paenibacillus alkalitolerans TaxID=2799335 RepID=UPI0018F680C6|nr:carbohydrate-binding domain-containing protein [Paenibacillus alkalitolerans]
MRLTETESESAKAVKAASDVIIRQGTFRIDSADDSIHSNGNITVTGGDFNITSGDDGIHADTSITIAGGTVVHSSPRSRLSSE